VCLGAAGWAGAATYSIDFARPSYCVTTDCSFDFRVDQISISMDSSQAGVTEMTVNGLARSSTDTRLGRWAAR